MHIPPSVCVFFSSFCVLDVTAVVFFRLAFALSWEQDTFYWRQQLWATHDQVECEVMQGMHDQGLPVVKVREKETGLVVRSGVAADRREDGRTKANMCWSYVPAVYGLAYYLCGKKFRRDRIGCTGDSKFSRAVAALYGMYPSPVNRSQTKQYHASRLSSF